MRIYFIRTRGYISLLSIFMIFVKVSEGTVLESFDLPFVLAGLQKMNTSSMCKTHLNEYINGLVSKKKWALKMYDSSANKIHGILQGRNYFINGYDECLSEENRPENFETKYCVLKFRFYLKKYGLIETYETFKYKMTLSEFHTVNYGMCLPSTCNASEIQLTLKDWLNASSEGESNEIALSEENCSTRTPIELQYNDWITIKILAAIGVITILSTLYDIYHQFLSETGKPHPLLASFSLYTNTKIFLSISDKQIKALDGLRTLSCFWIVLSHGYFYLLLGPLENPLFIKAIKDNIHYVILWNGYLAVDTFLFLSGLLVAHSFFKSITEKGHFDIIRSYIHRFLQLTPSFALVLLIQGTIFSYFGDGPLWFQARTVLRESCGQHWWKFLSYVHNFISLTPACMQHSWYLAADMQLYWLSPIFLFPLVFHPKLAPYLLMLELLMFCFASFTTSIVYNFNPPYAVLTPDRFTKEYIPFYTRGMAWLIGLALGYAFYRLKEEKITIKLSKVVVVTGWLISAMLCIGSVYSILYFFANQSSSLVEAAIYISFHRVAWALGLAWIVFACQYGYGGFMNKFLSWKGFQFFAKLSYGVYLIHFLVYKYRISSMRYTYEAAGIEVIYFFLSTLVISILLTIPLVLLVDIPCAIIDACIFHNVKILPLPAQSPKTVEKEKDA